MEQKNQNLNKIREALKDFDTSQIEAYFSSFDRRSTAIFTNSKERVENRLKRTTCKDVQSIVLYGNETISDSFYKEIKLDYCQFRGDFINWRIVQEPIILAFPNNVIEPTILGSEISYDRIRFPDQFQIHYREDGTSTLENYEECLTNVVVRFKAFNHNGDPLANIKFSWVAYVTVVGGFYFGG